MQTKASGSMKSAISSGPSVMGQVGGMVASGNSGVFEADLSRVIKPIGPLTVTRIIDVAISVSVIVYFFPVFLLIGLLIYFQDFGPVFYSQPRMGKGGRTFRCLKFRSMLVNSDHLLQAYLEANPDERLKWAKYRKLENDPRITLIGRIIRKTSLDEFPQLINVLRGEMSLVGPRPIVRDEVEMYGPSFRYYARVQPGITGLWQVMGRNNLTFRRRVALDRMFARRKSVVLYFVILLKTIPAVLLQRGSR